VDASLRPRDNDEVAAPWQLVLVEAERLATKLSVAAREMDAVGDRGLIILTARRLKRRRDGRFEVTITSKLRRSLVTLHA
jgi:hypothetical protein